jgi:hypothetical protein
LELSISNKYEVWGSQGQGEGEVPDAEFLSLEEAIEFVEAEYGESCFRIKKPDGTNHKWEDDGAATPNIILFKLRSEDYIFNARQRSLLQQLDKITYVDFVKNQMQQHPFSADMFLKRDYSDFVSSDQELKRLFVEMLTWDMFEIYYAIPWASHSAHRIETRSTNRGLK